MNRILVTGCAGYIGGQTALALKDLGYEVLGIDQRPMPAHLARVVDKFLFRDFATDDALQWIVYHSPRAIIHCAGTSLVGPSVANPAEYYHNNFVGTKRLLDSIVASKLKTRIVFSSSAAVYGEPVMTPCNEEDPAMPISPYGESKLMVEMMLQSYARAYSVDSVIFRYFNACGADSQARHGQEPGASHVIARVLESLRDDKEFTIYGSDYPTADGTCVRDYVHVEDIAQAHVRAIDASIPAGIYNLGNSIGISVQEILEQVQNTVGRLPRIRQGMRREGDPAILTASPERFENVAGSWRSQDLGSIINTAWNWYVR